MTDYEAEMIKAIAQARALMPTLDWYEATEIAAEDHGVSLPELQRALSV